MDRFSPDSLRVAPRRTPPRRARGRSVRIVRAAAMRVSVVRTRDVRSIALWSLGLLAAIALLPAFVSAQGFRSQVAWVTLTATKRLTVDSASNAHRTARGPSVSDIEIPSPRPAATFDSAAAAEIRVEGTGLSAATLWIRSEENRLVAVSPQWTRVPLSPWLRFRAVAPASASLGAQRWQVRYRRILADGTPVGREGMLVTVSSPAFARR